MEHRGTKRDGHVTGAAIAGQSPDSDLYAASATRPAAAPGSYLEGIMLNLGYCDVTASRNPVQPTWREKLAGIHDVAPLEAVSEREAVGREIIATFRVRPGDPIFCVVESIPEPPVDETDPSACECGDGSCDGCDREARR